MSSGCLAARRCRGRLGCVRSSPRKSTALGFLAPCSIRVRCRRRVCVLEGLRDLGYVDGKHHRSNIVGLRAVATASRKSLANCLAPKVDIIA